MRARPGAQPAVLLVLFALACARGDENVAPPQPAAVFGSRLPEHASVELDTDAGLVRCRIDPARVPRAAAMFVGLARGDAAFRDPRNGAVARRRYFDGLSFFRRIPDVLVQSGCPVGDGSGHPGYRIPLETSALDRALLAEPGALLLAHYQAPPLRKDPAPPPAGQVIGTQLVVALGPMLSNLGAVTVLGRCQDLEVVRRIAAQPADRPSPVLRSVRVSW